MLSQFNNLPGVYVHKEDGNLRILETVEGQNVVILGTSPAGPLGLFRVSDTVVAQATFDPSGTKEGTLIRAMYEALEGGAQNVFLYRIGAAPMAIDFLNGFTIIASQADTTADQDYSIYYSNVGGSALVIYDKATGQVLYSNDSVNPVDNGQFLVYGSELLAEGDKSITIGSLATPTTNPTFAELQDFFVNEEAVTDAESVDIVNSTKTFTTASDVFKAGQVIKTSAGTHFLVEYVTLTGGTYTVACSYAFTKPADVILESKSFTFTTADFTTAQVLVKSISANTGLNLTLNQMHTALARAYWELESAKIDIVVPAGVYLNENNVVNNEGDLVADPTVTFSGADFLSKVYEFENNGQLFFAYSTDDSVADALLPTPYEIGIDGFAAKAWLEGSHTFDTAALCTSDATIASAEDDISFSETNFGHQAAKFCHELSVNDNEAFSIIAVKPPTNYSAGAIQQWMGKAPTFDANGTLTKSGSGVLGYKFMSGSLGVLEGFFYTNTGYADGTAQVDRKNNKIDIGKYLDVLSNPIVLINSFDGTSTGYKTPGTALYAGLHLSLSANQPATNKKFRANARPAIELKKTYLDNLTAAKYVSFASAVDGSLKVVDAPTAALKTSDWNRRSANKITAAVVELIRNIAEPYIGSITSDEIQRALEQEINSALNKLQEPQNKLLLGGQAKVRSTRAMQIRGEAMCELKLVTAPELRRFTVYVALQK